MQEMPFVDRFSVGIFDNFGVRDFGRPIASTPGTAGVSGVEMGEGLLISTWVEVNGFIACQRAAVTPEGFQAAQVAYAVWQSLRMRFPKATLPEFSGAMVNS